MLTADTTRAHAWVDTADFEARSPAATSQRSILRRAVAVTRSTCGRPDDGMATCSWYATGRTTLRQCQARGRAGFLEQLRTLTLGAYADTVDATNVRRWGSTSLDMVSLSFISITSTSVSRDDYASLCDTGRWSRPPTIDVHSMLCEGRCRGVRWRSDRDTIEILLRQLVTVMTDRPT